MEHVRLGMGGKLKCDRYNEITKVWDRGLDASKAFFFALNSVCDIEHGTTLKDVFILIDAINQYDVLSPLLTGGTWLQDIVKEGLTQEPTDSDLNRLIIGWIGTVYEGENNIDDIELRVDFFGEKDGTKDRYALDLTSTFKISNIPLQLNDIVNFDDHRSSGLDVLKQTGAFYSVLHGRRQFTLYEILYGIFWELSFHGGPNDRDSRLSELKKQVQEIESGETKSFTLDEIKAKLEAKKCKKCQGEGCDQCNGSGRIPEKEQ